jgi:NADH dehydrogenase
MKMRLPQSDQKRIIIVGGGFGGLNLAKSLRKSDFQVILIDQQNHHNFQPLLYQIATAGLMPDAIVAPFRNIFSRQKNVFFRMARVEHIDAEQQRIETNIGYASYDYLVLATGATTNFFGMDRVQRHAYTLKTIEDALELRSAFIQYLEAAVSRTDVDENECMHFVLIGGGPTGLEMAGALAELKKNEIKTGYPDLDNDRIKIHLIEMGDELLAPMSDKASKKALQYVRDMGVKVWLSTAIEDYIDGHVVLSNGEKLKTPMLFYAAGVTGDAPEGLAQAKMAKGRRIEVDLHTRVLNYENIFAIGDIAAMPNPETGQPHPQLAQPAIQQGKYLAKYLNTGCPAEHPPFQYKDYGTMATVGKNKAVADLPWGRFTGTFAWLMWLFVHVMSLVAFRNRINVIVNWSMSYFNTHKKYKIITRSPRDRTQSQEPKIKEPA